MNAEEWLPIPGFPGYEVSDLGNVRSWLLPGRTENRRVEPKLLKPGRNTSGYPVVGLHGRTVQVHAAVLAAFIGPRPDGYVTRHLNGVKTDARLSNLVYGTPSENMQDQLRLGEHYWASRSVCARGHEYTPENTYVRRDGWRRCRACDREDVRQKRWFHTQARIWGRQNGFQVSERGRLPVRLSHAYSEFLRQQKAAA